MANTNYDITLRGKNRTDAAFNKANANVNSLSQKIVFDSFRPFIFF